MRKLLAISLVLIVPAFLLADYPRKELLVEVGEVAPLMKAKTIVLLDARPKADYDAGHIPGAARIDAKLWSEEFKDGSDAAAWSKRIGDLGIDLDRTVLLYDDDQHRTAARVWWILRYWGVKDVRVINGGWKGYAAAALPVQKEFTLRMPVKIDLKAEAERLATKEQMKAAIKAGSWQIVDTRSDDEFCGTKETAKKNGAMPGALHLEWSDAVEKKSGKFKTPEELTALFKQAGIDPKKPTATYCQSGGRAAMMSFTLELMGGEKVRTYYRSWAEWGNADDTPIVKPEKK
jgi:thiosulfate/3-mercaptopyruvate sulfurtransferase